MAHPYGTRRARGRPARRSEPEPPQPQPSTAAAGRPMQHPVPPSSSPSSSASQDVSAELQSLIRATVQSEVAQAVTQSVSTALEGALHPLLERLEAQPAPQADPSRVIRPAQNVPPRLKERILQVSLSNSMIFCPRRSAPPLTSRSRSPLCRTRSSSLQAPVAHHDPEPFRNDMSTILRRGWRRGRCTSRLSRRQPQNAQASCSHTSRRSSTLTSDSTPPPGSTTTAASGRSPPQTTAGGTSST